MITGLTRFLINQVIEMNHFWFIITSSKYANTIVQAVSVGHSIYQRLFQDQAASYTFMHFSAFCFYVFSCGHATL